MNEQILQEAGLTNSEATLYLTLIKNSPSAPPYLAQLTNESRTNIYKLLDSLLAKGLVTRDETQKKLRYWANNPSALLDLAKHRRTQAEAAEQRLQGSLPSLVDEYFKYSAQPSIRYFNGVAGIEQVYNDQIADALPVTSIVSIGIRDFYGIQEMHRIRNKFPKHGINRHVFYPDVAQNLPPNTPTTPINESDKLMKLTRTWLKPNDMQSPVEWSVYGNKLSIISLGTEVVGLIIESPQIAASFRELLTLLDHKIRLDPSYRNLPVNMLVTKQPDVS